MSMNFIMLIILALFFTEPCISSPALNSTAPLASSYAYGGALSKEMLKHLSVLPRVNPQLRPGIIFSDTSLPRTDTNEGWYWIPKWKAGKWHRETQKVTNEQETRTMISRADNFRGWQTDKNGEIWEYYQEPYKQTIDGGNAIALKILHGSKPIAISEKQVIYRMTGTTIEIEKRTKRIVRVYQTEEIIRDLPLSDGKYQEITSLKIYDRNGKPTEHQTSYAVCERTGEYSPVDFLNNRDMRASFKKFLQANNLADLIPDDLR